MFVDRGRESLAKLQPGDLIKVVAIDVYGIPYLWKPFVGIFISRGSLSWLIRLLEHDGRICSYDTTSRSFKFEVVSSIQDSKG